MKTSERCAQSVSEAAGGTCAAHMSCGGNKVGV